MVEQETEALEKQLTDSLSKTVADHSQQALAEFEMTVEREENTLIKENAEKELEQVVKQFQDRQAQLRRHTEERHALELNSADTNNMMRVEHQKATHSLELQQLNGIHEHARIVLRRTHALAKKKAVKDVRKDMRKATILDVATQRKTSVGRTFLTRQTQRVYFFLFHYTTPLVPLQHLFVHVGGHISNGAGGDGRASQTTRRGREGAARSTGAGTD